MEISDGHTFRQPNLEQQTNPKQPPLTTAGIFLAISRAIGDGLVLGDRLPVKTIIFKIMFAPKHAP